MSRGWQTDITSPQQGKEDVASQSNKLVLSARRAIVDKLRYDGVGKPLGLGSTI